MDFNTLLADITQLLRMESAQKTINIIVILGISVLSRSFISRLVLGWIAKIVKRTKTTLDDEILAALHAPMRFLSVIVGLYLIADLYLPMGQDAIVRTLTASVVFWALYNTTVPLGLYLENTTELKVHTSLIKWVLRVSRLLIVVIGIAAVMEIWGIKVGPILAGFGILGAAVALATQDLFKNLIGGFLILSEDRFSEGEWIKIAHVCEGTVEKIGLRSTCIRRFDQAPSYIPNAQLADSPLINFTRMTYRRIHWTIGLEYSTSHSQLTTIVAGIEKLVQGENFVHKEQVSTFVVIDKFNDSSIDIMIYAFTKTTNWGEWLDIKQQLALDIKQLVESQDAHFAFPSQSIYIEKTDGIIPPPPPPPHHDTV